MSNDRIPRGLRTHANRIGPGRYMDPKTKRIYVDSADMDDAFDEMIDDAASSDRKRIEEWEAKDKLPRPPQWLQDLANEHVVRHANRLLEKLEDSDDHGWRSRAGKRRKALLGRQAWQRSLGEDLDADDLRELEALNGCLDPVAEENKDDDTDGNAAGG
jgi:hypothetical protein